MINFEGLIITFFGVIEIEMVAFYSNSRFEPLHLEAPEIFSQYLVDYSYAFNR